MRNLQYGERAAFFASVTAGAVAAVAGGLGWPATAIVAGCLAALLPVVGRIAANKLARVAAAEANSLIEGADSRAADAFNRLEELRRNLAPRRLSIEQARTIANAVAAGPSFRVQVAHNRHEAEPAAFHAQMVDALKAGGLEVVWFGGMTNATAGIEVSGSNGAEKLLLMSALHAAQVAFTPVHFTDDPEGKRGVELWIGSHPGPGGS